MVLADRNIYDNHMENILLDQMKFGKIKIKTMLLNFQVKHEKHIDKYLKGLKSSDNLNVY